MNSPIHFNGLLIKGQTTHLLTKFEAHKSTCPEQKKNFLKKGYGEILLGTPASLLW